MNDPLAIRTFDVNGRQVTLKLEQPERDDVDFRCLATIQGLEDDVVEIPANGVDALQAVLLAVAGAGDYLKQSGEPVRWLGLESSGLPTLEVRSESPTEVSWTLVHPITPEAMAVLGD